MCKLSARQHQFERKYGMPVTTLTGKLPYCSRSNCQQQPNQPQMGEKMNKPEYRSDMENFNELLANARKMRTRDISLPDVEVWRDTVYTSDCCDTEHNGEYVTACDGQPCLSCELPTTYTKSNKVGWFWWSCFPGCTPDGEPNGPFDTKAKALADAQDNGDFE